MVIDRAPHGGAYFVSCESGIQFSVLASMVDLGALSGLGLPALKYMAERLSKVSRGARLAPLSEVLLDLLSCLYRPSRNRSMHRSIATSLITSICVAIQDQIEVSLDEEWWREASCLDLVPSQGKRKHRVMSNAYKKAVLDAAKQSSEPLSVRQLVGASYILRQGSREDLSASAGRLAGRVIHDAALRYLAIGREVFRAPQMLHYTIDGVQAGGDHQNVFFAWLPLQDVVGVPPLQARAAERRIFDALKIAGS